MEDEATPGNPATEDGVSVRREREHLGESPVHFKAVGFADRRTRILSLPVGRERAGVRVLFKIRFPDRRHSRGRLVRSCPSQPTMFCGKLSPVWKRTGMISFADVVASRAARFLSIPGWASRDSRYQRCCSGMVSHLRMPPLQRGVLPMASRISPRRPSRSFGFSCAGASVTSKVLMSNRS